LTVFYAPKSEQCERDLERKFDDVLHGKARLRQVYAERAARFEASSETLLRVDTRRNEPPVEPHGRIDVSAGADGLVVRGGSPLDMAALPEFPFPPGGRAMLRIELTIPDESILMAFFQTAADPTYSHRKFRDARLHRGRNIVFLELDDPGTTKRVLLRLEVYRYVIHALEVRAVRG
jgi:hypothetical protein